MSLYSTSGTITANGNSNSAIVRGWTTMALHIDGGTGTFTWQFKGPDGVWRSMYGGTDNITLHQYTANHMFNMFFGGDVRVRVVTSSASTLEADYQIIGNVSNRNS
jgi:hypothetical protein